MSACKKNKNYGAEEQNNIPPKKRKRRCHSIGGNSCVFILYYFFPKNKQDYTLFKNSSCRTIKQEARDIKYNKITKNCTDVSNRLTSKNLGDNISRIAGVVQW